MDLFKWSMVYVALIFNLCDFALNNVGEVQHCRAQAECFWYWIVIKITAYQSLRNLLEIV